MCIAQSAADGVAEILFVGGVGDGETKIEIIELTYKFICTFNLNIVYTRHETLKNKTHGQNF